MAVGAVRTIPKRHCQAECQPAQCADDRPIDKTLVRVVLQSQSLVLSDLRYGVVC